jgi:hypothetical protein
VAAAPSWDPAKSAELIYEASIKMHLVLPFLISEHCLFFHSLFLDGSIKALSDTRPIGRSVNGKDFVAVGAVSLPFFWIVLKPSARYAKTQVKHFVEDGALLLDFCLPRVPKLRTQQHFVLAQKRHGNGVINYDVGGVARWRWRRTFR